MAEVPEGGAELERVAWCAPGCGLAVGDQAGEGLVQLLGAQGRAGLDDALDLVRSGVALGVRDAGRDDDRLARRPARALPKTRSPSVDPAVTPGPKKSEARPMAIRTRPASAAASSSAVIAARARP